ncbi:hypothetical protein [Bryobacter aggregatus]|uniref:hypothetical protein n=1 Tax=Bryobacter aggregatus TaxID=360054 RepID=UPI001EE23BFE|nr:hypothetical protein [Bryobacter aggregatus]
MVGVDDELAVGPLGMFVSADQKLQGELFEHKIVGGLEFVIGKRAENGAWFGDVLDEEFVGELGEQRFHGGSLQGVKIFTIPGTQKKFQERVVRFAHNPSGSSACLEQPAEVRWPGRQ